MYAHHFKDSAHGSSCNNACSLGSGLHINGGGAMPAYYRVLQRTVLQAHLYHFPARLIHCFLDCYRHFTRFTLTHPDTAVTVSHDRQCGNTKHTATVDRFRDPVDRHHLFLAPVTAIVALRYFPLHPPLHLSHCPVSPRI